MDGLSGFNPTKAKIELERFHQYITEIYNFGREKFAEYNRNMIGAWHSPLAKQNSNAIIGRGAVIGYEIANLDDSILQSAVAAIKQMAAANSVSFDYDYTPLMDEYLSDELQEADATGSVGMNIELVDALVQQFGEAVNSICTRLDSLPTDLALYDPSNSLASSFQRLISVKKSLIQNDFSEMINAIMTVKEQETARIKSGVNNATQTLAG